MLLSLEGQSTQFTFFHPGKLLLLHSVFNKVYGSRLCGVRDDGIAAVNSVERKLIAQEPIDISGKAAAPAGEVKTMKKAKAKAKAAAKPKAAKEKGKAKVKAEFKPPGKKTRSSTVAEAPTPASSTSSKGAEATSDEEEDEEEEEAAGQGEEDEEEESDHEISEIKTQETPKTPESKKPFSQRKAEKTPQKGKDKDKKPFTGEGGVGALEKLLDED